MDSPTMPGSHIVIMLKLTSPADKEYLPTHVQVFNQA